MDAGNPYLSGAIESRRLDAEASGGSGIPRCIYWGEEGEPIEEWAKPVTARGPDRSWRWNRTSRGRTLTIHFLIRSANPTTARTPATGRERTRRRWISAKSTSGVWTHTPTLATGFSMDGEGWLFGTRSRGYGSAAPSSAKASTACCRGVGIDNRPFLRSMHDFGLCLCLQEVWRIVDRMLWPNPSDNQGVPFLIDWVRAKAKWEDTDDG
jgi:hypothetical protein